MIAYCPQSAKTTSDLCRTTRAKPWVSGHLGYLQPEGLGHDETQPLVRL